MTYTLSIDFSDRQLLIYCLEERKKILESLYSKGELTVLKDIQKINVLSDTLNSLNFDIF